MAHECVPSAVHVYLVAVVFDGGLEGPHEIVDLHAQQISLGRWFRCKDIDTTFI